MIFFFFQTHVCNSQIILFHYLSLFASSSSKCTLRQGAYNVFALFSKKLFYRNERKKIAFEKNRKRERERSVIHKRQKIRKIDEICALWSIELSRFYEAANPFAKIEVIETVIWKFFSPILSLPPFCPYPLIRRIEKKYENFSPSFKIPTWGGKNIGRVDTSKSRWKKRFSEKSSGKKWQYACLKKNDRIFFLENLKMN